MFERSGLAALSDLETPVWQELFALLENQQTQFLANESVFRSSEYKWPHDPLHTWSRVWEYPYVFHHLRKWRSTLAGSRQLHIADVGSGVTFFPFSVARLGYRVTCTDLDPVCERDLKRASAILDASPGKVDFRRCNETQLPFDDQELDAAYCVSVLEHIPTMEATVGEISRILRPGGLFVLTIDLDLRGNSEISPSRYYGLRSILRAHFDFALQEIVIHPADTLLTDNGPFAHAVPRGWRTAWFLAKQAVKPLLGKQRLPRSPFHLAVQGFILSKRVGQ